MKRYLQTVLVAALFVVPLVGVPALARAQQADQIVTTNAAKLAEVKARVEGRLDDIKQAVCEKRLTVIQRIMDRAGTQGTKHLAVFDKILDRVKDFYDTKNLSVANYEALVTETTDMHDAAQTAIDAVNDDTEFSCDGDNPVGKVNVFNGEVRAMRKALKEYRTSIKDLIVGIHSAAKAAEDADASEGEEE
jgi:hypothetical protein